MIRLDYSPLNAAVNSRSYLSQLDQQRNQLRAQEMDLQEREQQNTLGQFIQPSLAGDQNAMQEVMRRSPQTGLKLLDLMQPQQPMSSIGKAYADFQAGRLPEQDYRNYSQNMGQPRLVQVDQNGQSVYMTPNQAQGKQAYVKPPEPKQDSFTDKAKKLTFIGEAIDSIFQLPDDQQPAAYNEQKARLQALGIDTTGAPDNFDAATVAKYRDAVTAALPKSAPKEYQVKYAGYAERINDAVDQFKALADEGKLPTVASLRAARSENIPNFLVSNNALKYDQTARNFINAILRQESGAAIGDDEFENAEKQYLPTASDNDQIKAQKFQNMIQKLNNNILGAGGATQLKPRALNNEKKDIRKNASFLELQNAVSGQ